MNNTISKQRFLASLSALLKETFEAAEGIYLDSQTSLFETLDTVSAEEASRRFSANGANIAAHVDHMRLYLTVLEAHAKKEPVGKIDWEAIWRDTHTVTPDEWDALKSRLREVYGRVLALIESVDDWEPEAPMVNALAILAHNAYHLGAIRQILFAIR